MTQQVAFPADVARKMFPTYVISSSEGKYHRLPSITWLAGPILCEVCNGKGLRFTGPSPGFLRRAPEIECTACNGLGYPPIVEIVSYEIFIAGDGENAIRCTVHGRLALGTPVPVHPWETEDYDNVPSVEIRADGTIWYYDQAYCDDRRLEVKPTNITDAVAGTLVPGGLAYPTMKLEEETWWTEHLTDDPFWAPMGYCPRGVGRWQRFWRHWHHGRLMRYPRISVLVFCVRDTKPKHKVKP